ncbi:dihydrofolate reductase family protein [Lysobacter tyrosinilyticus]
MSKVVVTSFMSMDGVIEAPEKWSFPYWNDTIERFKDEELKAADAQLLGRKTYEAFAAAWPSRSGDYADRFNQMDKYVVSNSLTHADWNNTHVIGGIERLGTELPRLRARHQGSLLVHGSHSLVQALVQQDLVDEYHLLVYPLLLGEGRRLFANGTRTNLELLSSTGMGSGVVLLIYKRPVV